MCWVYGLAIQDQVMSFTFQILKSRLCSHISPRSLHHFHVAWKLKKVKLSKGCKAGVGGTSSESDFAVVQSLSCVRLFANPRTAACQASLSFTISWSLLQLMSVYSLRFGLNSCAFLMTFPLWSRWQAMLNFSEGLLLWFHDSNWVFLLIMNVLSLTENEYWLKGILGHSR